MKKLNFIFKKSFWKNVLAVSLILILCAGVIGGGIALGKYIKASKKTPIVTWNRGTLDSNGQYKESKNSIYTKDMFECRGLEITPDLASGVTYRVAFYDDNGEFLSMTPASATKTASQTVPLFAKYARVEINAGVDEDGEAVEIGLLSILKYSKQISIKVDKKQTSLKSRLNKIAANDLYEGLGEGWTFPDGEFSAYETGCYWSDKLDVSDAKTVVVKVKTTTLSHMIQTPGGAVFNGFFYYSFENGEMRYVGDSNTVIRVGSEGEFTYLSINVVNIDTLVIVVDEASSTDVEAYFFN